MKFNISLNDRNTYTYKAYRTLTDELLKQGKTTGNNHSENMIHYTRMNVSRMKRWDKRAKINEELLAKVKALPAQKWLVISEAWCGDAAQNLPWIHKLAELNPGIELTIILRDENLDIMDQFLTNGGRSIPKLIALDAEQEVLFNWGPRPALMQETYTRLKEEGLEYAEISNTIHTMYAKDKGEAFKAEFAALL
ncbi:MAG: thioredoxin family protein [Bacteroidia bacterium]